MWLQARAADEAGIQFRMLNASKGPAVRGPRAQMDRALYKKAMQRLVEQQPNLAVHDGAVTDLILERAASGSQASVSGVTLASGKQKPAACCWRAIIASECAATEHSCTAAITPIRWAREMSLLRYLAVWLTGVTLSIGDAMSWGAAPIRAIVYFKGYEHTC